ncbi:hypothetical protein C8R48DRAFT_676235 [Suillus tomentosus]|nr:hypothetical protein C8R48DRAFT_676235 [Suillus tomentosus]
MPVCNVTRLAIKGYNVLQYLDVYCLESLLSAECFNSPYGFVHFPAYAENISYTAGKEYDIQASVSSSLKLFPINTDESETLTGGTTANYFDTGANLIQRACTTLDETLLRICTYWARFVLRRQVPGTGDDCGTARYGQHRATNAGDVAMYYWHARRTRVDAALQVIIRLYIVGRWTRTSTRTSHQSLSAGMGPRLPKINWYIKLAVEVVVSGFSLAVARSEGHQNADPLGKPDRTSQNREALLKDREAVLKDREGLLEVREGLLKNREGLLKDRLRVLKDREGVLKNREQALKNRERI